MCYDGFLLHYLVIATVKTILFYFPQYDVFSLWQFILKSPAVWVQREDGLGHKVNFNSVKPETCRSDKPIYHHRGLTSAVTQSQGHRFMCLMFLSPSKMTLNDPNTLHSSSSSARLDCYFSTLREEVTLLELQNSAFMCQNTLKIRVTLTWTFHLSEWKQQLLMVTELSVCIRLFRL